MRGKHTAALEFRMTARITPACAGKTADYAPLHRAEKDHPRVCGENMQYNGTIPLDKGSPPRMRGKLSVTRFVKIDNRITPAHAGKTRTVNAPYRGV